VTATAAPFPPRAIRESDASSTRPTRRRLVRTAKVTPTGLRFLLLALAVGLTAVNTGNNILYLLFAMMLSLIVVAGVFSERVLARLSAARSLPTRLFANTAIPYQITLTNGRRFMPAFSLRIREERGRLRLEAPEHRCSRLEPGRTVTIDSLITFQDRGAHYLPGIEVTTTFPFGLFEKTLRVPAESEPLVYPAIGTLKRQSGRSSGDDGSAGTQRGTVGVSHLREYQAGDDPRFIHWKHSARRAKLVIREPEREGARSLVVVFSNRLPSNHLSIHRQWFEDAVRLTASLIDRAIRDGWEVLLATWDGASRRGRGMLHLERLLRTLATIDSASPHPDDRLVAWSSDLGLQPLYLVLAWDDPQWAAVRSRCEQVWVASQQSPESMS
jgi:uncharacterized protein (DUF58 family)